MIDDQPIAELRASPGRRVFACTVLLALGALLILAALTRPPALGWQAFLLAFGGLALFGAEALRRATALAIRLYPEELRDSSGTVLARLEDIARVERGVFAFKPSNGFLLHLNAPSDRAWRPGLWWRMGRRVGVGGTVGSGPSRVMADQITLRISGDPG
ncbi:MAG: hypothetical protein GVY31_10265 [Alphaproteobacteria bacterium]|jgi:hypothetical protein|nr:hypothetical protein [Alphaproteobacteria bacterium]